jgi:ubiquinone/menaquinone biosynthesis C-methylase UbiE
MKTMPKAGHGKSKKMKEKTVDSTGRKKLIQQYYSRRARAYDSQKARTWKSNQGFGDEVFEGLFDSLEGLEDRPILEACIGTGRTSLPLLEQVKPWLVGLDLSREMLEVAQAKLSRYKERCNPIMSDAEHLPFRNGAFEALICTSVMHYFVSPEEILDEFSRILRAKGVFIIGDLTLHERDNRGFLNKLERTVSHAHGSYLRSSEIETMLNDHGFQVLSIKTIAYTKPFVSLIEDKAKYFGLKPETLNRCVREASADERKMYALGTDEFTLHYTLIKSEKED